MIGSEQWFKEIEQHYGGYHTNVPRNVVSDLMPKESALNPLGMTGGDRMSNHKYAKNYSTFLSEFIKDRFKPYVIVECGILRGTGLAIWSTLFPNAQIIGLDIDLNHTKNNLSFLKTKGAFTSGTLELYEFDQFADNKELIEQILNDRKIDIAIDDGFHSDTTILNTYKDLSPHLNDKFCYFIEDNKTVHNILNHKIHNYEIYYHKQLTIITNKNAQCQ